jgi:hypothetical protein
MQKSSFIWALIFGVFALWLQVPSVQAWSYTMTPLYEFTPTCTPTPMCTPTPTCTPTPMCTPTPTCTPVFEPKHYHEYVLCGDYTQTGDIEKCEKYGCRWIPTNYCGLENEWAQYKGVCVVIPNKAPECQNIPYFKRINCGYDGITPHECAERGCCWEGGPNRYNWCYYPRKCRDVCVEEVTAEGEVCVEWTQPKGYGKQEEKPVCIKWKPKTKCLKYVKECSDECYKP